MHNSLWVGGSIGRRGFPMLGTGKRGLSTYIKDIFSKGEQGFFYDPNDLSTMFQDAAGTVPVSSPAQPIGLMLDKSKGLALGANVFTSAVNGYFDTGSTSEMLTGTLEKTTAWMSVTPETFYKLESNGGVADRCRIQVKNALGVISFVSAFSTESAVTYPRYVKTNSDSVHMRVYFKSSGGNATGLMVRAVAGNHAYQTVSASRPVLTNRVNMFNDSEVFSAWIRNDGVALTTSNPKYPNAVKLTRGASSVYIHRTAVTTIGTYTLTGLFKNVVGTVNAILANTTAVPMTKVGVTADGLDIYQSTQTIASVPNSSVTGIVLYNANDSVEVYGLDVRVTQQNSTLPPYQKVVGSTQFDTVGFPNYLLFDGTDDFLQTNNIDFTATDKMSLFTGVTKLADNAQIIAELSKAIQSNTGSFYLAAGTDLGGNGYTSLSRGSNSADIAAAARNFTYLAPDTAVLSVKHNISGDLSSMRRNGVVGINGTGDKGAGNFGNYPLYIGRRAGTTLPFNGHIYGLIGVGRLTPDNETAAIEKELAKRLGVTLNV